MNANSFYAIFKIMIREVLHHKFCYLIFQLVSDNKKLLAGFKNPLSFIFHVFIY